MKRLVAAGLFAIVGCGSFEAAPANPSDGGDGGGAPVDGGTSKLVFVAGAPLGAVQVKQADQVCDALIKQVSKDRRAIAWVYLDGLTPLERLGSAEGPWGTATGKPVFANRAALTSAAPSNPMSEGVDGTAVSGQKAWTGLRPDGTPSGVDCQKWNANGTTDEATMAVTSTTTTSWASASTELCDGMHPVICFEY